MISGKAICSPCGVTRVEMQLLSMRLFLHPTFPGSPAQAPLAIVPLFKPLFPAICVPKTQLEERLLSLVLADVPGALCPFEFLHRLTAFTCVCFTQTRGTR